ncbi:MAG TPA: hypothetical protein VMY87_00585 [Armatimonadota bacterium]|nr:hypothetical protein [Armatimonadota bacterium]
MSPQLAAGLTAFVGACLLAGWVTGFRHRAYVGWLGLAFLVLAGFLLALGSLREAEALGGSDPRMATLVKVLLFVWVGALLLSAAAAVGETARRLRELRASHETAREAFLEMARARREGAEEPEEEGADRPGPSEEDET